jgi:hypothetical protein
MSEPLTPRQHALKVAVLDTLTSEVSKAYKKARAEAQDVFAEVRKDGQTQQKVMLPDGTEIGLISIRGASPTVEWEGGGTGLLGWCKANAPHMVESYVLADAFEMADVINLIREHFPNLVKDRIRAASFAELSKQVQETDGYVISDEDGTKTKVATVIRNEPSGAFAYRGAAGAGDRIMSEWLAGRLREVAFGPLALPQGEANDA